MPVNYYGQQLPYQNYQTRLEGMQAGVTARHEIIRVNGENGARSFRMAPNSTALLLDETAPIVWFCQSDGAGYHTVSPYKIEPYQAPSPPDYDALEARIKHIEEVLGNDKSDT